MVDRRGSNPKSPFSTGPLAAIATARDSSHPCVCFNDIGTEGSFKRIGLASVKISLVPPASCSSRQNGLVSKIGASVDCTSLLIYSLQIRGKVGIVN